MPFADVIGLIAEEAAEVYRADGWDVRLVEIGAVDTMEFRTKGIRLYIREGHVVGGRQG